MFGARPPPAALSLQAAPCEQPPASAALKMQRKEREKKISQCRLFYAQIPCGRRAAGGVYSGNKNTSWKEQGGALVLLQKKKWRYVPEMGAVRVPSLSRWDCEDNEEAAVVTDGVTVQVAWPCRAGYHQNQFHKAWRSRHKLSLLV